MVGIACVLALDICIHKAWSPVAVKQRCPAAASGSAPFRIGIDSSMVLVAVTVTDALNRPVMGLGKSSFRLFDNSVEQDGEPCFPRCARSHRAGVRYQQEHES